MKAIAQSRTRPVLRSAWLFFTGLTLLLAQFSMAFAQGMPSSFADLAERVSPSVVNITTTTVIDGLNSGDLHGVVPQGSPFEDFFREFQDRTRPNNNARRSFALGSGFVISEDGFIVTNNHVIEGADEIIIEFFNGNELPAKLVGRDPNTDIALLKVEAERALPFVSFADSDVSRVGDWVIAVGNPMGQGFSVSAGIVSARSRELSGPYDDYIQTDTAINKGNSGGPLFNVEGDVIGVNTAILSPNGGSIGIGFAMASNVVDGVVGQLKEYGETRRGWLGVSIQTVTKDLAEGIVGLDVAEGALVSDVHSGPAKDAGILRGDVITLFDGQKITSDRDLVVAVGQTPVGKSVRVVVLRNGETETVLVTIGHRETAHAQVNNREQKEVAPVELDAFGIVLSNLTNDVRDRLGIGASVRGLLVVNVDELSYAFTQGLRTGDVISEAGQTKVTSVEDFENAVKAVQDAGRESLLLLVRRNDNVRFIALSLK